MTTSAPGKCPECGLYWSLLEGKFPTHQSNGLDCPMSGHEPQEWPPAGEHPLDTKYRAEAVASLATSSITVPESALAGVGAMDTPLAEPQLHWCVEHKTAWFRTSNMRDYAHPVGEHIGGRRQKWCHQRVGMPPGPAEKAPRKHLVDWGSKRPVDRAKGEAAGNNELDGVSEQGLDARQLLRPAPKPRAKRSPRGYIVAGDYESYPSLEAAKAALALRMEAWEKRQDIAEDPPILIAGHVKETVYIPARTIPATVKVVR